MLEPEALLDCHVQDDVVLICWRMQSTSNRSSQ